MFAGNKFSYESAKLRARLANRLSGEKIETLLKCKSLEEAVLHLKGTYYEVFYESYTKTGYLGLAELAIKKREIDTLMSLRLGFSGSERSFVSALLSSYEIENLKAVLAVWFNGVVLQRAPLKQEVFLRETILHPVSYDRLLAAQDFPGVIDALKDSPYAAVLSPHVEQTRSQKTLFFFHAALDSYYYTHLKLAINTLAAGDRLLARRFFATEVDFENLLAQLRYKDAGMNLRDALSYFFHGGSRINQENISDLIENTQALRNFLQKSYSQVEVKIPGSVHITREVELYKDAVMAHLGKFMRMSDPLSIAPVVAYFYWVREEEYLVISLLEGASFGMDEKQMEEILCLSQQQ